MNLSWFYLFVHLDDIRSGIFQDWFVKRKSTTSWTSGIGETKTCGEKEKDGGFGSKTLVWHTIHTS